MLKLAHARLCRRPALFEYFQLSRRIILSVWISQIVKRERRCENVGLGRAVRRGGGRGMNTAIA